MKSKRDITIKKNEYMEKRKKKINMVNTNERLKRKRKDENKWTWKIVSKETNMTSERPRRKKKKKRICTVRTRKMPRTEITRKKKKNCIALNHKWAYSKMIKK